jgi:hypothetical protein
MLNPIFIGSPDWAEAPVANEKTAAATNKALPAIADALCFSIESI